MFLIGRPRLLTHQTRPEFLARLLKVDEDFDLAGFACLGRLSQPDDFYSRVVEFEVLDQVITDPFRAGLSQDAIFFRVADSRKTFRSQPKKFRREGTISPGFPL